VTRDDVNNNNNNNNGDIVIYLVLAHNLSTAMHFIYIFNDYTHQGLDPCVQKAVAPALREAEGRGVPHYHHLYLS
jgi:hypothetical protein